MATPTLPPVILTTTTHNQSGTSIIASSQPIPAFHPFGPSASGFRILHSTSTVPASNTSALLPETLALPRCPPNGVMFCTTDIMPGATTPLHRTQSLDYVVVMFGEIVLGLDGGEEKVVGPGEMVLQRGTNHTWTNRGEGVCRMACFLVGSEKVVTGAGEELVETVIGLGKRGE